MAEDQHGEILYFFTSGIYWERSAIIRLTQFNFNKSNLNFIGLLSNPSKNDNLKFNQLNFKKYLQRHAI